MRGGEEPPQAPEITYIFTNSALRGLGLGGLLIERVEAYLREAGFSSYYVKTIDDPSNRAIGFYEDNGFVEIGRRIEAGRSFVEFQRKLDTPQPLRAA